jgi:hypothetical protein
VLGSRVMGYGISTVSKTCIVGRTITYPLLRKTTGTLILGVSEQFDDTLLVGGKTVSDEVSTNQFKSVV